MRPVILLGLCLGLWSCQSVLRSAGMIPMGSDDDVSYAQALWKSLDAERVVGARATPGTPFFGGAKPHGMVLEIAHQQLTVGEHTGFVLVKKNYEGEGVSVPAVQADRARFLVSLTVMYQRERGYDPDNIDWFWAKYRPDGTLFAKSKMMMTIPLAGRIGKGTTEGCIYCHRSAGGGDYIFYPEIHLPTRPQSPL